MGNSPGSQQSPRFQSDPGGPGPSKSRLPCPAHRGAGGTAQAQAGLTQARPHPQVPQGYNYRAEVRKLIPQLQVLDELPAAHTGLLASRKLDQDWLLVKEAIKEGCTLDSLLPRPGTRSCAQGPRAGATPPALRTTPDSPRRGRTPVPLGGRLLRPFSDLTLCPQSPAHTQSQASTPSLGAALVQASPAIRSGKGETCHPVTWGLRHTDAGRWALWMGFSWGDSWLTNWRAPW